MAGLGRFLLVLLGLLILWALAATLAVRLDGWPRVQKALLRLGDGVLTFAIGLLGFVLVMLVLRALGWLPPPRG